MGKLTNEDLVKKISEKYSDQVTLLGEPFGLPTFETSREQIIDLLTWLKNDPSLQFIYLTDITAIHYPELPKPLGLIGLHLQVSYQPALNVKSQPIGDNRIYIWRPHDDTLYHLILTTPTGCWAKAGLHTRNTILSIDDQPVKTRPSFYNMINNLKIGDKVIIEVKQQDGTHKIPVTVSGYEVPVTQITEIDHPSPRLLKLYQQWDTGN